MSYNSSVEPTARAVPTWLLVCLSFTVTVTSARLPRLRSSYR
jgi:hypothetical protein